MKVREVFKREIDRHIAPVVYLHEQEPERLADEVREYIFTPGIHTEMVGLLNQLAAALGRPDTSDLPAAWISGFYGSGKSSFAKLVGLALGGFQLPDGRSLRDALISRDDTAGAAELAKAWANVMARLPDGAISVVLDIGGEARENEHVDKVALRCLRRALGYCPNDPVAIEEMKLEADGHWDAFQAKAAEVLGKPWAAAATRAYASEDFSEVLHNLFPTKYPHPMAWHESHTATAYDKSGSVTDSVAHLKMLQDGRAKGKHIFFVIDEVSQYIIRPTTHALHTEAGPPQDPKDRMLRLQTFISALGQHFRGRVWLFALGQEKLDQAEADSPLAKMRDRFPPHLRVHLDAANIHDVVKRRLLRKDEAGEAALKKVWADHAPRLKLYGWVTGTRLDDGGEARFIDTYPLLPDHISLLLEISSGLRSASSRVQTDAASVRGLLQLIQELFRQGSIKSADVPTLLTLDQVYDVQRSGLPNDQSITMNAIFERYSAADADGVMVHRVAKAVVLLGYQRAKVSEDMVAKLLYLRAGDDAPTESVRAALARLKEDNFITRTEEKGYRLQDAAGQEWEAERRGQKAGAEQVAERILGQVADLFTAKAKLENRAFPLELLFTGGPKYVEHRPQSRRDETTVPVDLRFIPDSGSTEQWIRQSAEGPLADRFVWVVPFQSGDAVFAAAQELEKSAAMVRLYQNLGVSDDKRYLYTEEAKRVERLTGELKDEVKTALYRGAIYFRGQRFPLADVRSIEAVAQKVIEPRLRELYPYYRDIAVAPKELEQLLARDIPAGASEKFFPDKLGLLKMDAGRPTWFPEGEAPKALFRHIEEQHGCNGGALLQHFARPPFGYAADIVRACLVALFRAERVVLMTETGKRVTSLQDESGGVRDLFLNDRPLKNAHIQIRERGKIGPRELVAIKNALEATGERGLSTDRDALTDAIFRVLTLQRQRLREVEERLRTLPVVNEPHRPELFATLARAMDECGRDRSVERTLEAFHQHLATFQNVLPILRDYHDQLTPEALAAVRKAEGVMRDLGGQLAASGSPDDTVTTALGRLRTHLEATRPWRDHADLDAPRRVVEKAYRDERTRRAAGRASDAEAAREAIKREQGIEKLQPEQLADVLEPLIAVGDTIDFDAVAPTLQALDVDWPGILRKADDEARERLHRWLHPRIPVHEVSVKPKVLKSVEEVEHFVKVLRDSLVRELGEPVDGKPRRHVRIKVGG